MLIGESFEHKVDGRKEKVNLYSDRIGNEKKRKKLNCNATEMK